VQISPFSGQVNTGAHSYPPPGSDALHALLAYRQWICFRTTTNIANTGILMRAFVWAAAVSVCLVGLGACGEGTPAAAPAGAPAADVAPAKPKIAATIIDPTLFNLFLIVPNSGDTGTVLADGSAYEIRSVGVDRVPAGDGNGVLVRVPEETAAQLGERKVKVTVTARTSATNGSPTMKLLYFRPGAKEGSDWREFTLTQEYAPYSFEYVVPASPSEAGWDIVGFWADPEGKGRGIEVSGVAVETVD
jgi:hypothetical protein